MILKFVFQFLVLLLSLQERLCPTKIRQEFIVVCVGFLPLKISPSGLRSFINETFRFRNHIFHRVSDLHLSKLRDNLQMWIWDPGVLCDLGDKSYAVELWSDLGNNMKKMEIDVVYNMNEISRTTPKKRCGFCYISPVSMEDLLADATDNITKRTTMRIYESRRAKEPQAEEILCMMKQNEALCIVYVDAVPVGRREPIQFSFLAKYDQQVEKESWLYSRGRFNVSPLNSR